MEKIIKNGVDFYTLSSNGGRKERIISLLRPPSNMEGKLCYSDYVGGSDLT